MEPPPPESCEIDRLPEELLEHVLSLTSPAGACRAAAVSRAFRAAAYSDALWSCFLPRDLPQYAKGEFSKRTLLFWTKKSLFRRLSEQPTYLPGKLIRMQLDRATGVQCFAISARAMQIWWPKERPWSFVDWYSLPSSGCIQLQGGHRRLDVRAKFPRKLLSQDTTYAAYMLFNHRTSYKLKHLTHLELEASVGVAGSESTRRVALRGYVDDRPGYGIGPSREYILPSHAICPGKGGIVFPRKRDDDDWLEVELGEFHNEKGDDSGEVSMSVMDTVEGRYRGRFVVGSIELRSKQRRPTRF